MLVDILRTLDKDTASMACRGVRHDFSSHIHYYNAGAVRKLKQGQRKKTRPKKDIAKKEVLNKEGKVSDEENSDQAIKIREAIEKIAKSFGDKNKGKEKAANDKDKNEKKEGDIKQ